MQARSGMAVTINGRQVCKSTHTSNKRLADQLLSRWETEVFEGHFHLPKSAPPPFAEWAVEFLARAARPNTRKRYGSSVGKLKAAFARAKLSEISADRIDEYKDARLAEGVQPATINHDLRVLRRMMRLAERKRLICWTQSPLSRRARPLRCGRPTLPDPGSRSKGLGFILHLIPLVQR
jgi:hypothetical protein